MIFCRNSFKNCEKFMLMIDIGVGLALRGFNGKTSRETN